MSAVPLSQIPLDAPVTALWGVGSERSIQLERLGIRTLSDFLLHRPRRYEDRRVFRAIRDVAEKGAVTVRGRVVAQGVKHFRKRTRSVFELILDDGTGRMHCRWWNMPYLEGHFEVGTELLVVGRVVELKPRTIDHPETEPIEPGEDEFIHVNRIVPIHPLTEGLTARVLRSLVWRALEQFENKIAEPELAQRARQRAIGNPRAANASVLLDSLPARANAVRMIHFPEELADVEIARQRLALDEFLELQRQIQQRRKKFEANARALPCGGGHNQLIKPFLSRLGFKLTDAQTRVLREIRTDLTGRHPMRRLLQGDVGAGKTAVAASAALMAIESGFNVALMAPTEILAEQHARNFQAWFEPLGVPVRIQTASRKSPADERSPAPMLTIGTHALLTAGFALPRLGLVIIDEQHKFGVVQREELLRKGSYPHLLVMTATPIPRTLGLTLYGDLDVSVIDELPAGRGSIKTFVRPGDKLPKVWEFLREKLKAGRQAYVVYPRVEEDGGERGLKAVVKEFENVARALAPFKVGLLHGRLQSGEKEAVMAAFRANRLQALLATSLIEVGVDVPNATLMLIENAEAFGLAQLHQLRGRIGRGAHESFCILISDAQQPESRERLRVLEETTDGFKIAEADLKLRGPGELLGQQQSGLPCFRFGDLAGDLALIRQAREIVAGILD